MRLTVIKYNAGNVRSVLNALGRLGCQATLTDDPEAIRTADKVIFPGQGEASTTMAHLRQTGLDQVIRTLRQPVLGICIGMQLLCRHSAEGNVDCLGIFPVDILRFPLPQPNTLNLKVPQMGWNQLTNVRGPLFGPELEGRHVYCIHSYYAPICEWTTAVSQHSVTYSNALSLNNFHATQFHPEKSGPAGEQILRNFLAL